MSNTKDWLPSRRADQLTMAKNWLTIFDEVVTPGTVPVTKSTEWGIPADPIAGLHTAIEAADAVLVLAQSKETRTEVVSQACKTAFEALVKVMRDIKARHFFVPPLSDADLVSLGLKPKDTIPSHIGPPVCQVGIITFYPGKNLIGYRLEPLPGHNLDDRADYGFAFHYGVLPPGGATPEQQMEKQYLMREPQSPEELSKSHFSRRRKDVLTLPYETSGMRLYACVRYENQKGDVGPWGPVVNAVIP